MSQESLTVPEQEEDREYDEGTRVVASLLNETQIDEDGGTLGEQDWEEAIITLWADPEDGPDPDPDSE